MGLLDMFNKKDRGDNGKPATENSPKEPVELLPFPKKIMILVDGSQASFDAVAYAIAMAERMSDCHLCAAFVVDTANMDLLLQMHIFVNEERASFEGEMETKGRRTLDFVRAEGLKHNIEIETYLLKGRVTQSVLHAVRELEAEMLIIGGWHNGSTRKDTSSVEYQLLLDQADCPVVVIKHR